MIRMMNIRKVYYNKSVKNVALDGINLEINSGEYVAIMGSSGSGKSTLLNIIGGMDCATSGEYYYNDVPVHCLNARDLSHFRRDNVSFTFQQFALIDNYTVEENIEVPLLAKGISKKERTQMVGKYLELVDIKQCANQRADQLSGGQQQRCAIARSLVSGNSLILADEPTGALDKKTGEEIMDIFDDIHKMGKTIVVITHDPTIAKRADRIINIEDGKIVVDKEYSET